MTKWLLIIGTPVAALAAVWFFFFRGSEDVNEIEYRFAPVQKTELVRSITANGTLMAYTTVDVKSKAGGEVVKLAVDEGSRVKKGDLIAIIDPRDTQALYDQATADLQSAQAKTTQSEYTYRLQTLQSKTSVEDAKANLDAAQAKYATAQLEYQRQPALSRSAIDTAQAAYDDAKQALDKFVNVTDPQTRRDVAGALTQSDAAQKAAAAELQRQKMLLAKGYVSQAAVDQANTALEAARTAYATAQQRSTNLDRELKADLTSNQLAVSKALAALNQAKANSSDVAISQRALQQAKTAVEQARIALQVAKDNVVNNNIRKEDVTASKAAQVRNRVSVANAKVQLDSTTVVAPRDGVVTTKYLEEGTIVPPGTSTFAQGTSLVQLSDVTKLYVDCLVDEADIANVKQGQKVRVTTEAYPGRKLKGVVTRVSPAAVTTANVTTVKVRVEIRPGYKENIVPGMNASCEFITLSKPDVLVVPAQAIQYDGGKAYVREKGPDPKKPIRKEIQVGETGNDGVEVISGVSEGEQIVTAEINLKELKAAQQKMLDAQQGGGLAGGNRQGPRSLGGTTGGGSGGRGNRGGGNAAGGAAGGGGTSGGGAGGGTKAATPAPAPSTPPPASSGGGAKSGGSSK